MRKRCFLVQVVLVLLLCALAGCRGPAVGKEPGMEMKESSSGEVEAHGGEAGGTEENSKDGTSKEEPSTQKTQIIMSTFFEIRNGDLSDGERLIRDFNAQSDRYEVVLQIGKEEGLDFTAYYTKQNTELIAGRGPDLFVANSHASFPELVDKGVMEDLWPYIRRDLDPGDYVESALYAYEKDEKIYALTPMYVIVPYVCSSEYGLKDRDIGIQEITDCFQKNPGLVSFNGNGPGSLLDECFRDWVRTPEDMEKLRDYLMFSKTYGVSLGYQEASLGKNVMAEMIQVCSPVSLQMIEERYRQTGNKVSLEYASFFGGAPILDGRAYSINAASKNKEGAWEFIKYVMSRECQDKITTGGKLGEDYEGKYIGYLPIGRQQFDKMLEEVQTPIDISDEMKLYYGFSTQDSVNCYAKRCFTDQELREFVHLVDSAQVTIWYAGSPLWQILSEEAGHYFDDSKTIDEVMKILENRIRLYLSE